MMILSPLKTHTGTDNLRACSLSVSRLPSQRASQERTQSPASREPGKRNLTDSGADFDS